MFSSQTNVISSQNNVRKYRKKGHEQVYYWQDFKNQEILLSIANFVIKAF